LLNALKAVRLQKGRDPVDHDPSCKGVEIREGASMKFVGKRSELERRNSRSAVNSTRLLRMKRAMERDRILLRKRRQRCRARLRFPGEEPGREGGNVLIREKREDGGKRTRSGGKRCPNLVLPHRRETTRRKDRGGKWTLVKELSY